jgi:hypothetical protein
MPEPGPARFDVAVWWPALEKYGAVTNLTVAICDANGDIVCGPVPATPLYGYFERHRSDPGIFAKCVRRSLSDPESIHDRRD